MLGPIEYGVVKLKIFNLTENKASWGVNCFTPLKRHKTIYALPLELQRVKDATQPKPTQAIEDWNSSLLHLNVAPPLTNTIIQDSSLALTSLSTVRPNPVDLKF